MRQYKVQPGDTPASIASRPDMAGCPKCARDLVRVNGHKPTVTHPNGFRTFRELRAGETLNLPNEWFDGSLDARPPAYYAALPYADGVTPSVLGALADGVLSDYATLDNASAHVSALAPLDDQAFTQAANAAAALIDESVIETYGSSNTMAAALGANVKTATDWARQRSADLAEAIANNDQIGASEARLDAQNAFSTALGAARIALQTYYGDGGAQPATPPSPGGPILAAAQAAANAIASDANYCVSVAHPSSAVNTAVHAFKLAWNAANPGDPVPINTGNYEQQTADAIARLVGSAPPACGGRAPPPPPPPPPPPIQLPNQEIAAAPTKKSLSTGEVVGIGLIGAGLVGGAIYLATRSPKRAMREESVHEEDDIIDEEDIVDEEAEEEVGEDTLEEDQS